MRIDADLTPQAGYWLAIDCRTGDLERCVQWVDDEMQAFARYAQRGSRFLIDDDGDLLIEVIRAPVVLLPEIKVALLYASTDPDALEAQIEAASKYPRRVHH